MDVLKKYGVQIIANSNTYEAVIGGVDDMEPHILTTIGVANADGTWFVEIDDKVTVGDSETHETNEGFSLLEEARVSMEKEIVNRLTPEPLPIED